MGQSGKVSYTNATDLPKFTLLRWLGACTSGAFAESRSGVAWLHDACIVKMQGLQLVFTDKLIQQSDFQRIHRISDGKFRDSKLSTSQRVIATCQADGHARLGRLLSRQSNDNGLDSIR